MNWDAVSAIADWLGVLLIVVSLVYVAIQIRQNTTTVRAATELETGRQWSEFHSRVAHSQDMADIWDKGLTDPNTMTATEKRRFVWLVAEYVFLVECLFRQRELGFLSDESWEQHRGTVAGLLLHPLPASWWESTVSPYSPEFKFAIDSARSQPGGAVWSYKPLSDL
jgi:hypothetical protein